MSDRPRHTNRQADFSCGVIPLWSDGAGQLQFLLVKHHAGHWAFPKGHPESGETHIVTARRELVEESGVELRQLISSPVFVERYDFRGREGIVIDKTVHYYLGVAGSTESSPQESEIAELAWLNAEATRERISFDACRAMFDQALAWLKANPSAWR